MINKEKTREIERFARIEILVRQSYQSLATALKPLSSTDYNILIIIIIISPPAKHPKHCFDFLMDLFQTMLPF